MKKTEETDWKALPMPGFNVTIPLGLLFHKKQLIMMSRGVKPREMEDKWFVYWKENDLYFHRSWTGICLFIVRFEFDGRGAKAVEATVNRYPEQYGNTDDEYDAGMIEYLISVLLLHRPAKFPARHGSRHRSALEKWSVVGQAGFGVHPDDEEALN